MKTVLETIQAGAVYLNKRGVEDARRNMEYLLAHTLGCSRMQIYTQFDRPLEEDILVPLRASLKQRGDGVPLQHIIGHVSFYNRDFRSDSRALIPRPETEELVEMILGSLPVTPFQLLDVGCGSGVIGLTIAAERPDSHVTLVDVSSDALSLCRENAASLNITNITIIYSDLFTQVTGMFDWIVANLPYVPTVEMAEMSRELHHDPAIALFSGSDGLELLHKFIPLSVTYLKLGGTLALEIGHDQASQVTHFLESSGFTGINLHRDLSGILRFPVAKHI